MTRWRIASSWLVAAATGTGAVMLIPEGTEIWRMVAIVTVILVGLKLSEKLLGKD